MTKIVLLAVAAAWAAVLLPPLLRNRSENRPGSSVSDFNRQLSSLQRSVPTRGMAPMRSMARPLAQSPLARPVASGRPGQMHRSTASLGGQREHQYREHGPREHAVAAPAVRRTHGDPGSTRSVDSQHRVAHVHRTTSAREAIRRRRSNVLFLLAAITTGSFFLFATTHTDAMMYVFILSFLALSAYCYRLVQIRQLEQQTSSYSDNSWFRAA